ncbi:tripartite tricarboxylate transporter TctB family protein [Psychrobacillus sp. NPDC058041]|uniref:tripartite tricarboxylate transporter TctB family protein n=1 Tax=Psychrobacillus sp. NPDC058041 TaxID=3346310 RepID=UPI0036DC6C19
MNKKFDRFAGVAFLIIGILFLVESQRIPDSAYGSSVGPKIFPMGLGIILIALSIRLLYETFKYKGEESEKEKLQYKKFFIIFGSAILYAFFLEKIGYVLSTFLFLLIAFQTMERGKTFSSIVIAAIFSIGVYFLFSELLGGSLPGFPLF